MSTGNDIPKDKMSEFLERDNQKYENALINERRINKDLRSRLDLAVAVLEKVNKYLDGFLPSIKERLEMNELIKEIEETLAKIKP